MRGTYLFLLCHLPLYPLFTCPCSPHSLSPFLFSFSHPPAIYFSLFSFTSFPLPVNLSLVKVWPSYMVAISTGSSFVMLLGPGQGLVTCSLPALVLAWTQLHCVHWSKIQSCGSCQCQEGPNCMMVPQLCSQASVAFFLKTTGIVSIIWNSFHSPVYFFLFTGNSKLVIRMWEVLSNFLHFSGVPPAHFPRKGGEKQNCVGPVAIT